jgi:hypothetical protein
MKRMNTNLETKSVTTSSRSFTSACLESCQKVLAQIEKSRKAIVAEFRASFGIPEQYLRLAVNEAEALAWQTGFPHLVFPELAAEKAKSMADWGAHQRAIRQPNQPLLAAA